MVMVPDVSKMTFADAQAVLQEQSLTGVQKDVFDYDIPAGTTTGSEPGAGLPVDKESTVTVLVSKGPQDHVIPALGGMPADQARATLEAALVKVGDDLLFFTDAAENSVTAASVTPRSGEPAIDCTPGCTLHEGDSAVLSVSVGPVPDVTGKSVGDATAALNAKGLQIAGTYEETNESIDEGLVIRMDPKDGGAPWQPNDAVTLVISSGPPLFPVPNIVGMTRDQAKAELENAGFKYDYNSSWDLFPDQVTQVEAQDPAADSKHTKGTVVTFRIKAAL